MRNRRVWLDASAIGLSGLCLAHCLALPLASALLPALGAWADTEWMHALFLGIAVPTSTLALWGQRHRPSIALMVMAGAGMLGLLAGVLGWPVESLERELTVTGSVLLAAAHVWNWRRMHRHAACDERIHERHRHRARKPQAIRR